MQMPNATPQGIAGLMQKPQGQQPMPSPAKASPMAGLGSVDDRVSAYMGNPKPLEQRYAMSQDLLDLLALQKIKSQKDAAARQMQMQMAQQQAQNGEAGMTVAQQREKQVTELTKNELAQQRGDTAQHQNEEQQANLQKMMGGVAGAPGAAMAAQPQAMAAGGIVGYAGPQGSSVEDPRRKRREGESFEDFRQRMIALDDEDARARSQGERAANDAARLAELAKRGGAAIPPSPFMGPRTDPTLPATAAAPPAPAPIASGTPNLPVTPPAPPQAPPQALPTAPKPPGLAGLPGAAMPSPAPAQGGIPTAGPQSDFGKKLEDAALKDAQIDANKKQVDEEQRVEQRMALTPEQRNVYNEGIGGLQKMYQEQYDPERQRQEGLKRFLIGAGGHRYGELAGGAGSAMDYDAAQRAAKLKEFGDIQGARTGLIGIDRENVKNAIGAGQTAFKEAAAQQRTGLEAGSSLYGTDVKTRDAALEREVEKLKIHAQNAATMANRENLSFERARTLYGTLVERRQELERKMDDNFATQYGMLLMQEQSGKMEPAQKNQLDIAKTQLQIKKAEMRKELEPVLESARQRLGGGGGTSSEDQALINKYAKGK